MYSGDLYWFKHSYTMKEKDETRRDGDEAEVSLGRGIRLDKD